MKKKHKYLRTNAGPAKKSGKLVIILSVIAVILLLLIGAMLFLIPRDEEPAPTEPSVPETTAPAPTETETVPPTTTEETVPEETQPPMLEHMAELYEENPETIGWIKIDGTHVDYVVMYTPEDPEKYIHLDFEEKYSYGGLPFLDANTNLDPESQNLLIYGHNMRDGSQFASIMNYQRQKYWEEHRYIKYTTLYEERVYEIIAAFPDKVYRKQDEVFKFYQFIDPETEEEFNEGIEYFKKKTPYTIDATAEFGDSLITMVTCAYHEQYGRYVVVGRLLTEEEVAELNAATE